jgi:hypothetical protein
MTKPAPQILGRKVIVFTVLLSAISLFSKAQTGVVMQSSFETSTVKTGFKDQEICCSYSQTQSTVQKRSGSSSMRVELNKTDPEATWGNKRAELVHNTATSLSGVNANLRWWKWSNYFPSATYAVDPAEEIFSQWHDKNPSVSASPPLAFEIKNGRYRIVIRYSTTNYATNPNFVIKYIDAGPVGYDKWNDWVVNFNPQYTSDGFVKVWLNGVQIVDYKGPCFYNGSWPPYWKLGIYKWLWMGSGSTSKTTKRVFYVDDVMVGDNTASQSTFLTGSTTPPPTTTNKVPVANAGTDKVITLPTSSVTLSGSATDADGTIASYKWSKVSGPTSGTLANASTASTALSSLTQGAYVYRLTATDNKGATDIDDITVTVNGTTSTTNKAPVANAGSSKTITLPTNSAALSGSGTDADGTISSYKWAQVSGPSTSTWSSTISATCTVSNLVAGTYSYRLTVTDNKGATGTATVNVTVNATTSTGNKVPVANAGSPVTLTLPTNTVQLSSKSYDPDGKIAVYAWTQVSGPSTAAFNSTSTSMPWISKLVAGVYTFRLTITDNMGAKASATVTVTVKSNSLSVGPLNQSPIAKTDGKRTVIGTSASLNGAESYDPDGQIKIYNWLQKSGPRSAFFINQDKATAQVSDLVPGSYVFELEVTDNDGASAKAPLTLEVSGLDASNLPVARAGNDQAINLPASSVNLNGSASSDPNGPIKTYQWTKISGPGTIVIATGSQATTQVSNLVVGTYEFKLEVTDGDNLKATDIVKVTVNGYATNDAPVAVTNSNIDISLPAASITLDGSKSYDSDGKITLYQWRMINGPNKPAVQNLNAAVTTVTGLAAGVYVFELTVQDDKGALNSKQVNVNVRSDNASSESSALQVYPNPVQSTMTMRLDDNVVGKATLQIYAISGVVVYTDVINKTGTTFMKNYDLSNLTSGSYFVSVKFENKPAVVKKIQKL